MSNNSSSKNVAMSRPRSAANPRKRALDGDDNLQQQHGDGSSLREILFDENNKSLHQVNFDEAIRMATDNKINKNNSWNYALIDYFHDMNLLRSTDGSSINFQKAGATLDGCMKIYSSRIDSVTTETGQLLTGLSASRLNEGQNTEGSTGDDNEGENESGAEEEEGDENDEDGNGSNKSKQKKRPRHKNSSLVKFSVIRLKEFEKELNIDPLFKKILSDFDEGGAKSLLCNSLSLNPNGRMVFVETIKGHDENGLGIDDKNKTEDKPEEETIERHRTDWERNLSELLSPVAGISETDLQVCKPMVDLENVFDDLSKVKGFIEKMTQADRDSDNEDDESKLKDDHMDVDMIPENVQNDFGDNDYAHDFDMDLDLDIASGFSDHNDASSTNSTMVTANNTNSEDANDMSLEASEQVMKYFDETNRGLWRGSQHWKISALKKMIEKEPSSRTTDAVNINDKDKNGNPESPNTDTAAIIPTKKKSGEPHLIDFLHVASNDDIFDTDDDDLLFRKGKAGSRTLIIESERNIQRVQEYLLPEDLNWTAKRLATPFLKPTLSIRIFTKAIEKKNRISSIGSGHKRNDGLDIHADINDDKETHEVANQEFWANNYDVKQGGEDFNSANFFKDEVHDNDDNENNDIDVSFDAFDDFGDMGGADMNSSMVISQQEFTSQSPAQHSTTGFNNRDSKKPLNYSKSAKKVDVKLLKDNLWKSVQITENESSSHINTKLTDVVKTVVTKYKSKEKRELSTSFFFICMLHLANEHNLTIETTDDLRDLIITGDA